jgi:subtilisin-like proprotein convertase family protein
MNSKQNRFALGLVAAAGLAGIASGQVFNNTTPTPIPDSPTVVSTIEVSGFVGTVSDLNVVLNADHTFCADVDVILIPPGQTGISYLQLFTDVGSSGDNFRWTRIDQSAAGVIGTTGFNTAPFTADYRPEGGTMTSTNWAALAPWALASLGTGITDLSSLNGIDPNGTWTLVIDDDAGGDVGTLQYWSLEFNGAVDSSVPPFSVGTGTLASNRLLQGQSTNATVLVTTRSGGAGPSTVEVAGALLSGGSNVSLVEGPTGTWTGSVTIDANATLGAGTLQVLANGNPAGTIAVTIFDDQPPACPNGIVTFSGTNLNSDGPVGTATNGTFTADLTGNPNSATVVRISGRIGSTIGTATFLSEARVRLVAPDGTAYLFQPIPSGSGSLAPFDVVSFQGALPGGEAISGVWTVETFESINQSGIDAVWSNLCIALASPPSGTNGGSPVAFAGTALPGFGNTLNYSVTVVGGTGTVNVTVDGSAFGAGTITLTDPDNDNIFTGSYTLTGTETPGTFATPATITDSLNQTATVAITSSVRRAVGDLGQISAANEGTLVADAAFNTGEVRWWKFSLCSDLAGPDFLELISAGVLGAPNPNDTEIGIYRPDGTLVADDDDNGVLAGSALSFGAGSGLQIGGVGVADTTPITGIGQDGATLSAGDYYLAVGQFNITFGTTGFNATGANTGPGGTISVTFDSSQTCGPVCNDIDINNDGSLFDPTDIDAFLSVYGEGPCVPAEATCDGIDFNNDTSLFDPCDIDAFLLVFSEGPCTLCGV